MSDLKLLNIRTNRLLKHNRVEKYNIKDYIEQNSEQLLGVFIIVSDFDLIENQHDEVQTLGYDENHQLTVIEYRSGKFSSTINKGLVYLDYIKNNHSKIKSILNEKLGFELANNIIINPRLISIGDDYNQYDEYAIKQMPYTIDLIKYQLFDKNYLLLEKNYQSRKIDSVTESHQFNNQDEYKLYRSISEFILSLGDEVCEVNYDNYISYRKIKNFIYIIFDEFLQMKLKINNSFKTIKIKSYADFEKSQNIIEKCYDEN